MKKLNLCFQYELKETGHTPELITEHDGREVPMKSQSHSEEADRQTDVSESRYAEPRLVLMFLLD